MILSKRQIKKIDLDFEINQKIANNKLNELIIIVPTNRKSRHLKKELISSSPHRSAAKINIETMSTYVTKLLFDDLDPSPKMITEAEASVLMKQSYQAISPKYFSYYKKEIPSGTLERIKNVISEYKRNGITPQTLREESKLLEGSEKLKAEDIAEIFSEFQTKCNELGLNDIGDIYFKLISLSKDSLYKKFRALYPEVDLIVVNGFDEFTAPEIEIINLSSEFEGLELYLYFDYYNFNHSLFSHLESCYKKFLSKGFNEIADKSNLVLNDFQNLIRSNLFALRKKSQETRYQNDLIKIEAKDREEEIQLIAKEIKKLILFHKVNPHKVCVAFNLIQNYSPIIRDVFNSYQIPFNLTDRYLLSNDVIVTALINFLEIIENDFYYKNIFRALSLNYLKIKGIDLSNILKASVDLKIISGYKTWVDSLNNAIMQPSSFEDHEMGISESAREVYQKALEDITKLYYLLKPFSESLTISEFKTAITSLIFNFDIPTILVNSKNDELEKNIKAFESFYSAVIELLELLSLEYKDDEKLPLKFFLNNIRTAVSSTRYNIKEKPGYGVQITTVNEIRGLKFDYLFISGLCDGDFPTRYSPEIFFSGSFMKNEKYHQTQERYHFYQSLCSWNKKLYLTYPKMEERRELVRSSFVDEFLSLFAMKEKNYKDYTDTLFNQEELLKYVGRLGLENIEVAETIKHLHVNLEEIKKSLNIQKLRTENPLGETEYTGFIRKTSSSEIRKNLEKFAEKEYSITQLETYALCPYKYFAEHILNLKPVEEPSEEIESLEMGSLLHSILYEFYTEIKKQNIVLYKANQKQKAKAEEILFAIARQKVDAVNFNKSLSFFEVEKILGINQNRKNSILYKFLEQEINSEGDFIPEYFELSFGNMNDNKKEFSVGDVKLRGKIDRVDLNHYEKKLKVVDYKLGGKTPTVDDLSRGLSLQLPLYMYVAKQLIKAQLQKDYEPAGAEIYSLKFHEKKFGPMPISTRRGRITDDDRVEMSEELINICLKAVNKYIKEIQEGRFHLSSLEDRENKVCQYCNFRSICRIQELA